MKLTKAQRELLSILNVGARIDITDTRIARALEQKGLAECIEGRWGPFWRTTETGRQALKEGK